MPAMNNGGSVVWSHRHGDGARRSVIALLRYPVSLQLHIYWEGVWDAKTTHEPTDLDHALTRPDGPYAAFSPTAQGINAALMYVDLLNPGAQPHMQRMKALHDAKAALDAMK